MRTANDDVSAGNVEVRVGPERDRSQRRIGPTHIGISLLSLVLLTAIFAPSVARSDPNETGLPFAQPSGTHLLGTDDVGHDLWAHLVHGARVSVVVGLATATIAMVLALTVSLVSVYRRGWFETIAYRVVDLTQIGRASCRERVLMPV